MHRTLLIVVILAALVAAAGLRVWQSSSAWELRAVAAEAFAAEQSKRAAEAERVASLASARADSIARAATVSVAQVRERVVVVREVEVPEDCVTLVAERDELIDEALAAADEWQAAYTTEVVASTTLREAVTSLRLANDSLTTVLAARPSARSRLLPTVGVGPIAGMCATGPCYGFGVQLSWRLF